VTRSARSAVPVLGIGATQYTRPKGSTVVHEWNGTSIVSKELKAGGTDDVCEWWLVITSADLLIRYAYPVPYERTFKNTFKTLEV